MDHHRIHLLSSVYQLLCCLLGPTAVLVRPELSEEVGLLVLRHDNAVVHRQVTRVRYAPANRRGPRKGTSRMPPGRTSSERSSGQECSDCRCMRANGEPEKQVNGSTRLI
jgi:hypothetical protein